LALNFLQIIEDNFVVTFSVLIGIGLMQGIVLGRGLRNRFPSLKNSATIVSLILLILFSINAILNVIKFVNPHKISLSNIFISANLDQFGALILNALGLNTGLLSVLSISVTIVIFLLIRITNISGIARYFVLVVSSAVFIVGIINRFTEFAPNTFEVTMYAVYQFGVTAGIFFFTRRKR